MSSFEWIRGFLMGSHSEPGGPKTLEIVASIAFCTFWPADKLAQMMIRVAVRASCESWRRLGDSPRMTTFTGHSLMGAGQWKSGPIMIEALHAHRAPVSIRMALQTCRTQAAFMWILVAIGTARES